MPEAARVDDHHVCPQVGPANVPHQGGKVLPEGKRTVFIGGPPAARVGDKCVCTGPPDEIAKGSTTVKIEEKWAARRTDPTQHGGTVVEGCGTVTIADTTPGAIVLLRAGAPLLEICEKPAAAVKV